MYIEMLPNSATYGIVLSCKPNDVFFNTDSNENFGLSVLTASHSGSLSSMERSFRQRDQIRQYGCGKGL